MSTATTARTYANKIIERRNWIYGGRRRFWNITIGVVFVGIVVLAVELITLQASAAMWWAFAARSTVVVAYVGWRWVASRKVNDRDQYRSLMPAWRRFFAKDGGASQPDPNPRAPKPVKPWGLGQFWAAVAVWFGAQSVLAAVLVAPGGAAVAGPEAYLNQGLLGGTAIAGAVTVAFVAFVMRRRSGIVAELGLKPAAGDLRLIIMGAAAVAVLSLGFALLGSATGTEYSNVPAPTEVPSIATVAVMGVALVIVAPVVEEILLRGLLLGGLLRCAWVARLRVAGVVCAIAISSIGFGLLHLGSGTNTYGIVALTACMGAVLGWLRLRSGRIFPSIVVHAANNATAFAGVLLAAYGLGV